MCFSSSRLAHCFSQSANTKPRRQAALQVKLPVKLSVALLTLLQLSQPVSAQDWQFSAGVATLARQQPWQDIKADYQLLPMFSARYGNWQFGTSDTSLASYSWQLPAEFNLQLGLGVRDLGYGAKTQSNKKLSEAAVFRGYQHPDPEAVFNASMQWRWFSCTLASN
jgi:outer membrane scaffolding protein for murein synthesis (MipA/OmpV family)